MAPFQMGYSKSELSGSSPVPDGWYKLQLISFSPKIAGKEKDSVSLNAQMEIIQHSEHTGRKIFASLNSKAGWILQDFVHACGLEMEEIQDANAGTEAASYTIPGVFEGSDQYPDDPSKWKYQGPLTNQVLEAEVATTEYMGKKRNEVRQYKCAVPNCAERHSVNLLR